MKILMVAPFEAKGRYKGGITYIAEHIYNEEQYFKNKNILIEKFDTCRINRNIKKTGKISLNNLFNFFKIYTDLPKENNKKNYDMIYYHSSVRLALLKDLFVIKKIRRKNKSKIILHIHFAEYDKIMFSSKIINRTIISIMNKSLEKIIFLSEQTSKEFVKNGLSSKKVSIIYNFHNLKYSEIEINNKVDLQQKGKKIEVLFLASIDKRKGIIDALQALDRIEENYTFHICGTINDLSIEQDFKYLINKLGDKVILHGYVSGEKKSKLLLQSDVLLLPSYGEGLPISIIEGLAAGCSIITTCVGAIPEVLSENNGYIIEPGNVKHLRSILETVICDYELRQEHIKNNIIYSKKFGLNKFINNLKDVFEEVML